MNPLRCLMLLICIFGLAVTTLGQSPAPGDDALSAALAPSSPSYARVAPIAIDPSQPQALAVTSSTVLDFPAGADSSAAIFAAGNGASNSAAGGSGPGNASEGRSSSSGEGDRSDVSTIDGLDSLATFSGAFINQAGPSLGKFFPFTMVGNHPALGGTTVIPAPITTVSLRLLNDDGSLNVAVPFKFADLFEDSPNFEESNYRSGQNLQYADAVHRAQFFNVMGEDWHTVLKPQIVNSVTMNIPFHVNVRFPGNVIKPVQAYIVRTLPDGTHWVRLLDLLFNNLWFNQLVNDIKAGNITTNAISHMLFPNTYLFSIDKTGQPAGCCVLGFHTYVYDPSVLPQPRWVTEYASWISPGIFKGGFQDVTAMSHEVSEIFGDPFVNNATASWQFPGVPANAKACQNNLEEGDPIEVLPTATVPLKLKERNEVFTYHPQIIPLLQWFEMGTKSNAIDGAFSFPDETTLKHSALPCPQ
ncbi:MAG TPA: hypothetical protein VM912_04295 [Terriglobales bacterium]|nr:hypothetical protein [Terriglobales bacterium]